ncbi:hypothetical protein RIF29_27784 [Crotalaria pallida]|uniref:Uncharacterized protein n=1 Tax=Crotalaria pallida TaxID=3830 RepID=A0AAN9EQD8_CROPI
MTKLPCCTFIIANRKIFVALCFYTILAPDNSTHMTRTRRFNLLLCPDNCLSKKTVFFCRVPCAGVDEL